MNVAGKFSKLLPQNEAVAVTKNTGRTFYIWSMYNNGIIQSYK